MAKSNVPPQRRVLQQRKWPALDQELWQVATAPDFGSFEQRYGARLRPETLSKYAESYGRFLGFLAALGELDEQAPPPDRVTFERAGAFIRELQQLGNQPETIRARMTELKLALRILAPQADFRWLTAPDGHALTRILPKRRLPKLILDQRQQLNWGLQLMKGADRLQVRHRSARFRDGLAIAILAARAPRLRSIISMELGRNVVIEANSVLIRFEDGDIKNERHLEYHLPKELVPLVHRYVDFERPMLLSGGQSASFWISEDGKPLSAGGMQSRIRFLSQREFGKGFSTHIYRTALGTGVPALMPESPAVAAAILGISSRVAEQHYNRGGESQAAAKLGSTVLDERVSTKSTARREIKKRLKLLQT